MPEEEGTPEKSTEAGIPTEPQREIKRRARITREEVARAGYTIGCPGCKAVSRNAPSQNHTEACRKRIEETLKAQGGASAKRIAEGNERYERHLSKRRQTEAQDQEEEQRKRPVNDEGNQEETKQARQQENPGKRAPEDEEENEHGNRETKQARKRENQERERWRKERAKKETRPNSGNYRRRLNQEMQQGNRTRRKWQLEE